MSIVIAVEKPSVARRIAPVARRLFPGEPLSFPVFWPFGLYAPALPRGLKWQQYPCVLPFDPEHFVLRKPGEPGSPGPLVLTGDGEQMQRVEGIEAFNTCLRDADRLIAFPDPGPGVHHYQVARQKLLGQRAAPGEIRALYALDEAGIERALSTCNTNAGQIERWSDYGRTKHYFDYQFAINSLAIFGKTANSGQWVSKYQLQALYMFSHFPMATESEGVGRMHHWTGTGRYAGKQPETQLGSATSRTTILAQLEQHGWVEALNSQEKPRTLALSEAGRHMLARLHPNCEDPDLPFRLHDWCERGLEASKPAIDRYIPTFFGRQKRFIDKIEATARRATGAPSVLK